jgi:hypothetical protein
MEETETAQLKARSQRRLHRSESEENRRDRAVQSGWPEHPSCGVHERVIQRGYGVPMKKLDRALSPLGA